MWNNYFFGIQSKYNMRVSLKNPLVIRLDGKNVTKSSNYDLLNNYEGSFFNMLEKTVKYFTSKYHCFSIFGSDEVNFIFTDPMIVIEDLDKEKVARVNEIISLFSQYFYDYFNELNKNIKIFWHGKCFSIDKGKVNSYLKFRSKCIRNVMTTYYLKRKDIRSGNTKLEEKDKMCMEFPDYQLLKNVQDGILYFDGNRIDLEEFYAGNIKVIDSIEKDDSAFLTLLDFE